MATLRSKKRSNDPADLAPDALDRLIYECEQKIERLDAFEPSEDWKLLSTFLDARSKRLEHEGRGFRRNLMRPKPGQPPVTLEQIAAHEARIDENAVLRRLPKVILAHWRDQLTELHRLRDTRRESA